MKSSPRTGDIFLVDLGMAAKTRPCLVLCANPDSKRTVSIVAPLTTVIRGGESEVSFPKPPWLDSESVVNLSGILGVERHRLDRRLGQFPPDRFEAAQMVLASMFGLEQPPPEPSA